MLEIFPDLEVLSRRAAEIFLTVGNRKIGQSGRFTVVLSGGSTPRALFQTLAAEQFRESIDWSKIFFFFGDERDVAPDDAESNFRSARENLFAPLGIKDKNVFRWQTESKDAAADYQNKIKNFFDLDENEFPRFDLIFLGMGADGHTASLFPFSPALVETKQIAVANPVEKLNATRLTLTFPAINNAEKIVFLVAGADKSAALKAVLEGGENPAQFPSQNIKSLDGEIFWLIDEKAAAGLSSQTEERSLQ